MLAALETVLIFVAGVIGAVIVIVGVKIVTLLIVGALACAVRIIFAIGDDSPQSDQKTVSSENAQEGIVSQNVQEDVDSEIIQKAVSPDVNQKDVASPKSVCRVPRFAAPIGIALAVLACGLLAERPFWIFPVVPAIQFVVVAFALLLGGSEDLEKVLAVAGIYALASFVVMILLAFFFFAADCRHDDSDYLYSCVEQTPKLDSLTAVFLS